MPELSRRKVIRGAAIPAGAAAAAAKALAAPAAKAGASGNAQRHGDLRDIKHIVVLMQENLHSLNPLALIPAHQRLPRCR